MSSWHPVKQARAGTRTRGRQEHVESPWPQPGQAGQQRRLHLLLIQLQQHHRPLAQLRHRPSLPAQSQHATPSKQHWMAGGVPLFSGHLSRWIRPGALSEHMYIVFTGGHCCRHLCWRMWQAGKCLLQACGVGVVIQVNGCSTQHLLRPALVLARVCRSLCIRS